jgi:hypothetical protein
MNTKHQAELVGVSIVASIGFGAGLNLGNILWKDAADHADGRVQHIQVNNEQIRHQLSPEHKLIAHLVLNDGNKTFKFETTGPETCNGQYQVEHKTAQVVGSLTCSYVEVP